MANAVPSSPDSPLLPVTFLKAAKFFFALSVVLMITSAVLLVVPGPKFSIEFTGGSLMEILPPEGSTKEHVADAIRSFVPMEEATSLENAQLLFTKRGSVLIRMRTITNEEHLALVNHLSATLGKSEELQFTTIGPTVGETLKARAAWALVIAWIAIILYIAAAFRKIPRGISSWSFSVATIVSLFHDTLLTLGIFVILGLHTTFEIDMLFVSALLSIMGYSVNDTIVIFDRIRANLQELGKHDTLENIVERSIRESLARTLNTGIGALIMLFALFFMGAESIRWFILALIIGTLVGTYSSFFVATPLLVYWSKKKNR